MRRRREERKGKWLSWQKALLSEVAALQLTWLASPSLAVLYLPRLHELHYGGRYLFMWVFRASKRKSQWHLLWTNDKVIAGTFTSAINVHPVPPSSVQEFREPEVQPLGPVGWHKLTDDEVRSLVHCALNVARFRRK